MLPGGIEPTTSPLPRECSTTELRQLLRLQRLMPQLLAFCNPVDYLVAMAENLSPKVLARKKREAEALKANIKRRKQAVAVVKPQSPVAATKR